MYTTSDQCLVDTKLIVPLSVLYDSERADQHAASIPHDTSKCPIRICAQRFSTVGSHNPLLFNDLAYIHAKNMS